MSVITCKVTEDKIQIATDTQLTKSEQSCPGLLYSKVAEIGELIIGQTGSCEEGVLFFNFVADNSVPADSGKIVLFMSEFYKYRDSIYSTLKPKEEDGASFCQYYIAIRGHIFLVNDFFVCEVTGDHAIGCGDKYALGAMAHGASVVEAVEITCKYDNNCSLPVKYFEMNRAKEA